MSFVWQNPKVFMGYLFSISISGDSASYFFAMTILISLKGTLAQTRMWVGRVTLPSKGPMRGQNVLLMAKSQVFDRFYISLLVLLETHPQFLE